MSAPPPLLAALLIAGLWALPRPSEAASCCAGASTTPGRLMVHEDYLVGVDLLMEGPLGDYDPSGRYRSASSTEFGAEQGIFGTLRLAERGQLSARLPLRQTYRDMGGLSEWGGGVADLSLSGRWDFLFAGERLHLPGIALLANARLPTGRAPEAIEKMLGTDATGTGATQLTVGAEIEQLMGPWLVQVGGSVGGRLARTVRGREVPASWLYTASAAVAYGFVGDRVLAGSATFLAEPEGSRQALRLGLAFGMPFSDTWRMQARVFADPPLDGLGRNHVVTVGGGFLLLRSWS